MVTVRCWNLFQFKCANGWFPLWPSNFKIKCQKIMVALVILACWLVQKCNTSKMQHMLLTQGHRLLYCNFGENLIIQIDACGTKVAIVLGQFCMHCMKAWLFLLCDTATPPLLIQTQTQTQTHPMVVLKSKTWWWHANRLGFYVHCNITKWYMEQCHWKTLQLNAPGGHNNFVWSKIQIFKFPGWWDGLLHYFARTCLLRYSENSPAVFQPVEVQGNVINMEQGGLPKDETQMEFCCWMKQTIKTHNTQHTTHNTQHTTHNKRSDWKTKPKQQQTTWQQRGTCCFTGYWNMPTLALIRPLFLMQSLEFSCYQICLSIHAHDPRAIRKRNILFTIWFMLVVQQQRAEIVPQIDYCDLFETSSCCEQACMSGAHGQTHIAHWIIQHKLNTP